MRPPPPQAGGAGARQSIGIIGSRSCQKAAITVRGLPFGTAEGGVQLASPSRVQRVVRIDQAR